MFGSEVRFLHCAATVIPERDKSDLNTLAFPEQENIYLYLITLNKSPCLRGGFYYLICAYNIMKIKKQHIIIGLIVLAIFLVYILSFGYNKKDKLQLVAPSEQIQIKNDSTKEIQPEILEIPIQGKEESKSSQIVVDENNIKVSLTVLNEKYETSIKEGASVFDVMKKIQKESTPDNIFNFKYINNASLGNFITEINGKEGTPGKYWIYYVNNKKASVGVSNYILKSGDIINWSQEGI